MSLNRAVLAVALTAGLGMTSLGLAGCNTAAKALGVTKVTPDEYRVVTKAPLVVPPDYSLRPPAPGQPRPQELQPESAARNALLGQSEGASRTEGEKLLTSKAGGDKADPLVRYVVDDEFGDLAHKEPNFADRVLFWRKSAAPVVKTPGAVTAQTAGAETPSPIDPVVEAQRLKTLTDGQAVVIRREGDSKVKLPGL